MPATLFRNSVTDYDGQLVLTSCQVQPNKFEMFQTWLIATSAKRARSLEVLKRFVSASTPDQVLLADMN
ncbi:hypothetical protein Y032_0003g1456 [Ancylostoma ceylanicum]|uniref:Uncharacterized protein n=1 Tax=Ancylostoma ceylanicum TaxID=53326 RepID=A0A016VXR2_9BILA|nr:hypothetical protein Y032_0003g1456 [Ancylostoma ceylanicum]